MTICDLCLKENRPLNKYSLRLTPQWPRENIYVAQDCPLICQSCERAIVRKGLFNIIKESIKKDIEEFVYCI